MFGIQLAGCHVVVLSVHLYHAFPMHCAMHLSNVVLQLLYYLCSIGLHPCRHLQ